MLLNHYYADIRVNYILEFKLWPCILFQECTRSADNARLEYKIQIKAYFLLIRLVRYHSHHSKQFTYIV